jgi:NAD(P)-dependent dehydrogenase (short-subunit alcohol dehydrogenase family)
VLAIEGGITEPATADRIIEGALERFGHIDTLAGNAGVYISKPVTDDTTADYALVTGVNLTGFFWVTQRPSPRWRHDTAVTSSTSRPPGPRSRIPARPRSWPR